MRPNFRRRWLHVVFQQKQIITLTIFKQRVLISGSSIIQQFNIFCQQESAPNEYVIHVASFDFSLVTALYMGMLAMQGYLSTNVIYIIICLLYYFVVFCRACCGCLFGSNFIITPQWKVHMLCVNVYLIGHSPSRLFRTNVNKLINKYSTKHN